jgi:hypothetical protein
MNLAELRIKINMIPVKSSIENGWIIFRLFIFDTVKNVCSLYLLTNKKSYANLYVEQPEKVICTSK